MYWSLFTLILMYSGLTAAQDILGCGGFVKSKVPIDFSKVEIKLVSPDGIQKYQTECAPNNGYFMVPFVDKGHFILKVDPPKGWSFAPTSVELHIDGINDPCSQGRDINFEFLGFTISGQVKSVGTDIPGPEGVTLTLRDADTSTVIRKFPSDEEGKFQFPAILPGKYKIEASHKTYTFEQNEILVTVAKTNVQCSTNIIVSGYDVTGKVTAAKLPAKDVHILLMAAKPMTGKAVGCNTTPPVGSQDLTESQIFICAVKSNSQGSFVFPSLPPGDYTLLPFHKAEHMQFDVKPQEMKFSVTRGSVVLSQNFAVTGFSVTGLVLDSKSGGPVSDARILVNGKEQAVTNVQGLYKLQHMNSGLYDITVQKTDLVFPKSSVKVGSDTPRLPDIIAAEFALCGQVTVTEKPSKSFTIQELSMKLKDLKGKSEKIIKIKQDSSFCFFVSPGSYSISPMIPSKLSEAGLALKPSSKEIVVQNRPVKNLNFQQQLVHISAMIRAIDSCRDVTVELVRDGSTLKKKLATGNTVTKHEMDIVFKDVLPGSYSLQAVHEKWCWKSNKGKISALDNDIPNKVEFEQLGYELTCSISHDISMMIEHKGVLVDTFSLKKGHNQLCLAKPGKYTLTSKSCHKFDSESIVYDTDQPRAVVLQAVSHEVVMSVESIDKVEELEILIRTSKDKVIKDKLRNAKEEKRGDKTVYLYSTTYRAADKEQLNLLPKSNILLFEPFSMKVTVNAVECTKEIARFKAFKGLFIEGVVSPKLQDVEIFVSKKNSQDKPVKQQTDSNGKYKIGPLHPDIQYSIKAKKEGYVLVPDEKKPENFVARKLAKILFSINTEDTDEALSGVLLTVSGGSYRSNNLTDIAGSLVLQKLEPGQYYFKAVMKEYEFKPSSQVIDLKEGDEMKIAIKGKRIAFSCYGSVTSLNGQPESEITVQAFAVDKNIVHAEETVTGDDGEYRIKGLIANTQYKVKVKQSEIFDHITPPEKHISVGVEDVRGTDFIAFRSLSQFELSGNIVTDNEFLRYLKVVLYAASSPDIPVHSVSLAVSPFFHLPPLARDNTEYHVKVESSLDRSRYTYTEPAAGFFASGIQKHITFQFEPKLKVIDHDTPQASFLTLPIALIVLLIFYNHAKIIEYIQQATEKWNASLSNGRREAPEQSSQGTKGPSKKARKDK